MAIKKLDAFGEMIFNQRYSYPNEKGFGDRMFSIAKFISSAETDEEKPLWENKFYDVLSSGDLVPGGRIIYGSGRGKQNLLNCYVLAPQDNVENLGKTISDIYRISCAGGGIGINFSSLRPRGNDIGLVKNSAPGSVSVMELVNAIGEHVRSGKNRRTALLACLEVTHPDIFEFLHVKLDLKRLNNFNISIAITDRFIEACENDEDWHFTFNNKQYFIYRMDRVSPNGSIESINNIGFNLDDAVSRAKSHMMSHPDDKFENVQKYPLKALELWRRIWKNSVESGDPGVLNIDLANRYTNVSYFERLVSVNPCGEQWLSPYSNCCLSNINLSNMVENGEVNWKRLTKAVRYGVRFLDNVLSVNYFPIEECKEAGNRSRRIGLGVMGLHYMLIKLGLRYGSEKCLEFIERLFTTIRDEAYLTSCYLGREKGSFPAFNAKLFLKEEFSRTLPARIRMLIKEHGIRNALLLNIPPTGTTSIIMGTSSGLEPIFSAMYKRRFREANTWREVVVLDPLFKEYLEQGLDTQNFVGAYDVTPIEHIQVQATIQKYIDSAISKTINLPPEATAESFSKIALNYMPYIKGMTVYRGSSRPNEPLEVIPLTPANIEKHAKPLLNKEGQIASGEVCKLDGECG